MRWLEPHCFCSAHQDCRTAAFAGCGVCARAVIEALERIVMAITRFAAIEAIGDHAPDAPAKKGEA